MKTILVLGAGLVGKTIALDLAQQHLVTVVDINRLALGELRLKESPLFEIKTIQFDILTSIESFKSLVESYDLVVSAVPGFMGFEVLKNIISARKNVVDISFFPEDPFELNELAIRNKVTAVIDCGVAPGMGNIILGYHYYHNDLNVKKYHCMVGGLPQKREWPLQYKAVFSPIDVIEEYTRPARYIQNGIIVTREALSDPELINFDEIGTLESWNSDGLRTLLTTIKDVPDMIEKTLRYEGTIEYLRVLRKLGFFSKDHIEVNDQLITPLEVTSKLLFPQWKLQPGEKEFTIMRVEVEGVNNQGLTQNYTYDLLDKTSVDGTLSMARTTGYTCTAVANLVLDGKFSDIGVCPPEYLGKDDDNLSYIFQYLYARGVVYKRTVK